MLVPQLGCKCQNDGDVKGCWPKTPWKYRLRN